MTHLLTILISFGIAQAVYGKDVKSMGIQFFGDTYIPNAVLEITQSSASNPQLFRDLGDLLSSSYHNVVNLESSITRTFLPFEYKTFHLKMPPRAVPILRAKGITFAGLANNHSMDYGSIGLTETIAHLASSHIQPFGAGKDLNSALAPAIDGAQRQVFCVLAFSLTYPNSFWATKQDFGTAHLSSDDAAVEVSRCAKLGYQTFAVFHWGEEMNPVPREYQWEYARAAIDAGATAVLGHHPHIVQPFALYKGRPIFFSLGNFVFGTRPAGKSVAEGAGVAFSYAKPGELQIRVAILNVDNTKIQFIPKLGGTAPVLENSLSKIKSCQKKGVYWYCRLPLTN